LDVNIIVGDCDSIQMFIVSVVVNRYKNISRLLPQKLIIQKNKIMEDNITISMREWQKAQSVLIDIQEKVTKKKLKI